MSLNIIHDDITTLNVDAIVNAANINLRMGSGVCGAIFNAAGADMLKVACDKLAPIKTSEAVLTQGFNLPAKYIIHAAGPIYRDGNYGEEKLLRNTYINSMKCAIENGCRTIAFPLISSGSYGYPKEEAVRIAIDTIHDFIHDRDISVFLVVFEKNCMKQLLKILQGIRYEKNTQADIYSSAIQNTHLPRIILFSYNNSWDRWI